MSKNEVVALLGEPIVKDAHATPPSPSLKDAGLDVPFIVPSGGGMFIWEMRSDSAHISIKVLFDSAGRVSFAGPEHS